MTRVLIVDDEPGLRRALAINLHARGYTIDLADQATSIGRNWTLMRAPTGFAVLGTACSQVRWQEPPITIRSPWPTG